jgi:uncharacterized membrane protein YfcA
MAQRPFGISILSFISALSGVLGVVTTAALLLPGIGSEATSGRWLEPDQPLLSVAALLVVVPYILLQFIQAYGYWRLRRWGWPLGMALAVLGLIGGLLGAMLIGVIASIVILWYLMRPHVRAAFGRLVD